MEAIIFVLIAVPLTYFLLKFKFSRGRKFMESYIEENGLDAEILKIGIPPIRLWLRNRKGDNWAKLKMADGTEQWARVRSGLLSGTSVEFFS